MTFHITTTTTQNQCPQYLSYYFPKFDHEICFWDHIKQVTAVRETFVRVTFVLTAFVLMTFCPSSIEITDLIETKVLLTILYMCNCSATICSSYKFSLFLEHKNLFEPKFYRP